MCNVSKRCPHTDTYIIKKDETYDVKGEPVAVEANVRVCKKCNEEIFDMKLDTENLKRAYQKYKKAHGLLMSEEIMRIRNRYKLGQRTFAKLIGCTQATLVRYEKGTIQNDTHNRLILLMDNPDNLRETYRKIRGELSETECRKIELALAQNQNKVAPYYRIFQDKEKGNPTEYSGFQRFNFQKLKNIIIYYAQNQKKLYKTKLMKLLWYTDALNFSRCTKSISGLTYIHLNFGPVPEDRNELLGLLEKMDVIRIEEDTSTSYVGERIETDAQFDASIFSEKELDVLRKINEKFDDFSSTDLVKLSHEEDAYLKTSPQGRMSFVYALNLKGIV